MKRGTSGINALVAIDKPCGMTSHDVVMRVRRACAERRVGHAGTLDPDASGLLVVGVGQGTRLMGLLTAHDKVYEASVAFGSETDTDDAQGTVTRSCAVPARLGEPAVAAVVVASLVGKGLQVPPAYSAISVNGKRSYELARAGEAPELAPRPFEVLQATLLGVRYEGETLVWDVRLHVSKGTYVRAIARDLGRSLGCAAHLCALRRCASGNVSLEDALSLEELEAGTERLLSRALDPVVALGLPVRRLDDEQALRVAQGQRLPRGGLPTGARVALVHGTRLVGVWGVKDGRLCCEVNFPQGIEGVRP